MIILVDVDGVIAPIHIKWIELINKTFGDKLTEDDIDCWDAIMTKSKGGVRVFDLLPYVYENTKPTKGALDGIKALRDMKHKVVFVTNGIFLQKIEWIFDNGFSVAKSRTSPSDIIIASDKSLIIGDVLIDDYYMNFGNRNYPILFNARWNEHINGYPRAFTLEDAVHMIENIPVRKEE
jgi:5'(3')-deoxyribonucleotidase